MIVQQHSVKDMTFCFQMNGQPSARDWVFTHPSYNTVASKSGPITPFWENSLAKDIFEYRTTKLPYVTPPRETRRAATEEIIGPLQGKS